MTSLQDLAGVLTPWMTQQRWFGGKGRTFDGITVRHLDRLEATSGDGLLAVYLVFVDVSYPGDETERYQVPLSARTAPWDDLTHAHVGEIGGEFLYDAPHDPDAASLLLSAIREERAAGEVSAHQLAAVADQLRPRLVGAEQSNTSIVYGEELILKLFRRVAPGLNPDLELTRALQDAGSTHVAEVVGWIERAGEPDTATPDATTLGLLQRFALSASEGWALAQASVRDLYAEADLHADEVGGDFAAESHRLGVATGEVHQLLAQALPVAEMSRGDLSHTRELMVSRLDRALAEVPELVPYGTPLREAFDALSEVTPGAGIPALQRTHGDFHLGQVLRTDHGWIILDFEGEPARPLPERRALASPLRDIAGMLRSYEYAARSQLMDFAASGSSLEYRAGEWAQRNREAFCDGYAEVVGRDPREHGELLRAFELDKAVYEVMYEAHHRPTWLKIPLGSIARLGA